MSNTRTLNNWSRISAKAVDKISLEKRIAMEVPSEALDLPLPHVTGRFFAPIVGKIKNSCIQ
jgi:hypothetical protein